MSKIVEAEVESFKRKLLEERLAQCTQSQRDFFARLYPRGVPAEKLISSIDLCDRTIRKNNADPSRGLAEQA